MQVRTQLKAAPEPAMAACRIQASSTKKPHWSSKLLKIAKCCRIFFQRLSAPKNIGSVHPSAVSRMRPTARSSCTSSFCCMLTTPHQTAADAVKMTTSNAPRASTVQNMTTSTGQSRCWSTVPSSAQSGGVPQSAPNPHHNNIIKV